MRLITRNDHAELLRRSFGGWMFRRVPVHDASGSDFEDHEHVHHAERCGDCDEEIARQHGLCVIPHEGTPGLRPGPRTRCRARAAYTVEPFVATLESQAS